MQTASVKILLQTMHPLFTINKSVNSRFLQFDVCQLVYQAQLKWFQALDYELTTPRTSDQPHFTIIV